MPADDHMGSPSAPAFSTIPAELRTAPKVSCIVIVFNGEAYLKEAVDSVLAQSFKDWELLIVDDGSTDHSGEIAQQYAEKAPGRIRVLRHPDGGNHGMSAARNLGLGEARGEYLAFLDADDVWMPGKLAVQTATLDSHPDVGLTYGRALIWHSWAGPGARQDDFFYDLGLQPNQVYKAPELLLLQLCNVYQSPTSSGSLLRRVLATQVGGFEAAFKGMFEDAVFFAKVLLICDVFVSEQVTFKYRQHSSSASAISAAADGDYAARLSFLDWLAVYLDANHAEARVTRRLRSVTRQYRVERMMRRLRRMLRRLALR